MDGLREYSKSIPDHEIIEDAYKYFEQIVEDESECREAMRDDDRFIENHWDDNIRARRENDNRPCLQIARLNQFLNQVKNEERQNRPSIKVSPVDSGADIKAAEYRQGIIRHIQYDSDATNAYQAAFDKAVDLGRGFFRINTAFVSDTSVDKKIVIETIPSPLQVYMGRHEKLDYSDCKQGFITEDISKEEFKKRYPDADPTNWNSAEEDHWMRPDDLTIANFYCIWAKKRTLIALPNGVTGFLDELDGQNKIDAKELIKTDQAKSRVVHEPVVMWYKMTRKEILKKERVPGKYIPILPVIGVEKRIDGKLFIKGMVRDGKDPSKMLDYWTSSEAEHLTLSLKAQWVIAKGQAKGYEETWARSNRDNIAYLSYNPTSHDGHLVPPPQRQQPPSVPVGFVQAKMGCIEDLKAVTGIYDAGLGSQGNETSGRAILARQRESDTANYHYLDNLRISLTHAGRIINDWIPEIYDTPRIIKIMGDEDEEDSLELGSVDKKTGKEIELGSGTYDVVVTMGANFSTKRQEAVESIMELMRVIPNAVPIIYDLLVQNMDIPFAQEMAERLKKTIPPDLLKQEGGEQQLMQMFQQAQQQNQQAQMVIQQLTQQLEQLVREKEAKVLDNQTKLKVAGINAKAKTTVAEMQALAEQDRDIRASKQRMWDELTKPMKVENNNDG